MKPQIATALETLNVMVVSEETVAEFYMLCSERFTERYTFWAALAREEMAHARVIDRLIELVRIQPSEFTPGKSTPVDTIRSFIKRIEANIQTLKQNDLPEHKALLMAYHIENTIIEQKFADLVDTENDQYKALLDQVISDTHKHKERVGQRIRKLKEGAKPPKKSS